MPRPEGSKNKPKSLLDVTDDISSENLFLAELIRAKTFWNKRAEDLKKDGKNNELEIQYAEFYKLGINRFTELPQSNS